MNLRLRHLLSRQSLTNLSRLNRTVSSSTSPAIFITSPNLNNGGTFPTDTPSSYPFNFPQRRAFHASRCNNFSLLAQAKGSSEVEDDEDTTNEFLARFVHKMRGHLNETYPNYDKQSINFMLKIIVEKLVDQMEREAKLGEIELKEGGDELSEELWRTVLELSDSVCQDMERERKKEKMKKFLQSDEVKAMARFAGEVGVRRDMLRELRFKWAREAMDESEFYESLEQYREEGEEENAEKGGEKTQAVAAVESGKEEIESGRSGLPKRHGKIKFKLYGLDLSGEKWREVANRIHETEEVIFPQEPREITGKCEMVTDKILGLGKDDEFESLLGQWMELLEPKRVDWMSLLEKVKERDRALYLKVAEHVLSEPSFEPSIRDYSKLIDVYAKENRLEDAERILSKMGERGLSPDIIVLTTLVHMYSKSGNLEQAKNTFVSLKDKGFTPDFGVYQSMVLAYVNAGLPRLAEGLMREMETRDFKPTKEIYMALLKAFADHGDTSSTGKIELSMQWAGFEPTLEYYTLLVGAYAKAGKSDDARARFDDMIRFGYKPDDKSTSVMLSAYEKNNELDKALDLYLKLEKDGFEPGIETYSVLVDWLAKLNLVDEVEQMLGKIALLGETPPLKIQVSLCDMYATAGIEKKALQALGVLEAKKDLLKLGDFERVAQGLLNGGFVQEAQRIVKMIEAQGFDDSKLLHVHMMAANAFGDNGCRKRPGMR